MVFGALFLSIQSAPPVDPFLEERESSAPPTATKPARPARPNTSSVGVSPPTGVSAPPKQPTTAPWSVLTGKKLHVKTKAGLSADGVLLGVENGNAIIEDDDGDIISIPTSDVESVRTIKVEPAEPVPPPVLPSTPIPTPQTDDEIPTAHTGEERMLERLRLETRGRRARGTAIAGGVFAGISTALSIAAEGVNIHRWAITSYKCDEDVPYGYGYDDNTACGWTDDGYSYFLLPSLTTPAFVMHVVAGPMILVPTSRLRREIGYREKRGRQIAAWSLWGIGMGSLVLDMSVAWSQFASSDEVCGPSGYDDCYSITPTRGAPPPFYLISAGLTLSSAILGIIDANEVSRQTTQESAGRPAPTVSVFPFRLQRGGGFGVAGRF